MIRALLRNVWKKVLLIKSLISSPPRSRLPNDLGLTDLPLVCEDDNRRLSPTASYLLNGKSQKIVYEPLNRQSVPFGLTIFK